MEKRTELRELILEFLGKAGPEGLTLGELVVLLRQKGKSVSERTIRRVLNELLRTEEKGREPLLVATTRISLPRRPGRPERVYILRRFLPRQLSLFELAEGVERAKVNALDELPPPEGQEDGNLLADERERRGAKETGSVLARIAAGQLEDERLARAIIEAAPDLAREDPVRLLTSMLNGLSEDLNGLARRYLDLKGAINPKRAREAERVFQTLEIRFGRLRRYFGDLWGLDSVLTFPSPSALHREGTWSGLRFDRDEVVRRLRRRVYGDKVLRVLDLGKLPAPIPKVGSGTDASVADILLEHREGSFLPPAEVHVFTAAAALEVAGDGGPIYTDYDIFPEELRYYDDFQAAEEGFLLASRLREFFGEKDLRHARYAALSLRQYAEDLRVLRKEARWRPMGRKPSLDLPPPVDLIIRDGRIFPTVHRLKDFEADNLYGRLVRNEIAKFNEIVDLVRPDGPYGHVAYTGVVKQPEFSWISPIVFWFLYERGKIQDIELVYRAPIPDHLLVHLLFLGLAREDPDLVHSDDKVFCTFGMLRRFSDVALERDHRPPSVNGQMIDEDALEDWENYIRARHGELNKKGQIPALDPGEYRPFLMLCARSGVLMAYGAPCAMYRPLVTEGTSGHFLIPRLEAAAHLEKDRDLAHAGRALERLLAWLSDPAHRTLDLDHTFPAPGHSGEENGLAPLVPKVTMEAHGAATFARTEMASAVEEEIRRLIKELRNRYSRTR